MHKRVLLISLLVMVVATAAARVPASAGLPPSLPQAVASGDTTQTTSVLWARSTAVGAVTFDYGTDATFATLTGVVSAIVTNTLVPAKMQVSGLMPNTDYFYRVTDAAGGTATGRLHTAAARGTRAGLRFGVSGDWRGELSPYPAVANADERDLDFFVELGDTIYADYASPVLPGVTSATTLDEYRLKHTEVYSTRLGLNTLGDLRAATSVLAVIDDHEVLNDFAGGAPSSSDARFPSGFDFINDTPRYENGLQAFQEYNPLRDEVYGATGDPRTANERKLYRANTYGNDAAVFVLDARSFRDTELPGITDPSDQGQISAYLTATFAISRTMLGQQQLADVQQDLLRADRAGIVWKFVLVPEPIQNLGVLAASDRFEGYAAERTKLLKFIHENDIRNVVFVAADIHGTIVNNLTYQEAVGGQQIATKSFEITTGSVAFEKPFGPTVVDIARNAGLISAGQYAFYLSLSRNNKDLFMKQAINDQLDDFGYSPIGLEDGLVNETLVAGTYFSAHVYGWTEFDINPTSGQLRITTYGINWYGEADLASNPNGVINRPIEVVSEFTVTPETVVQRMDVYLPLIVR